MLSCFAQTDRPALTLHATTETGAEAALERLDPAASAFARAAGFRGRGGELLLLPGGSGIGAAILGLGSDEDGAFWFGAAPFGLPEGTVWRLAEPAAPFVRRAVLGWGMGAYRFGELKTGDAKTGDAKTGDAKAGEGGTEGARTGGAKASGGRAPAQLRLPDDEVSREAVREVEAVWLARDLINRPANLLGPTELADAAEAEAIAGNATFRRIEGEALEHSHPTVAMVGRGADRPPVVAEIVWKGSGASHDSPLVVLCGKGVVFDTGGLDLKPAAGMLLMKKDMGGAAVMLALARLVMAADLPIRLRVLLGCVENAIGPRAMRPLDVVATRKGLTVEIGNTDAEGRLVLCDLLADAAEAGPALVLDAATLTGAARVALGPELPALFSNDDGVADGLLEAGRLAGDPLWRLPLWRGYDGWLSGKVADIGNVSSKPFAGSIVAALFLQRFVPAAVKWAHLDIFAWNESARPGRPEGGEATGLLATFTFLRRRFTTAPTN